MLNAAFGEAYLKWPNRARVRLGDADFSIACVRLGIAGEIGIVVAGSERVDFPEQTERLLLDAAANQAALAVQQARLLNEQRRAARELEERVSQRTRELAEVNEQLRRSEQESRMIVDNIPGLIALLSPAGDVDMVNRQLLEYFGQTLEELRLWGTNDTIHPEDLPGVIDVFSRSIAAGSPYEILQRFKRSDGIYRWFQNRGFPVRDSNGNIARWCVLLTDVDDQKRAEDAVRESEYESRLIVNSIPGIIAVVNTSGEIERVSQPVLDYYGKSLEELKVWTDGGAIHPEDLPGLVHAFTQSISSGDPLEFEARAQRFDGAYRWIQTRGLPLRDRQGRIARWHFLQTDVDERKRAEDALQSRERDLRLIIDTIPALAWCNLPDGSNEFLSKGWHEYTGLGDEAHGWGWRMAFHPDDLPPLLTKWAGMLISGELGEIEARLRRHDGVYRWFLIRAEPFHDDAGNVVRWYGTSTDIEDRKRAEEEVRLKEVFLTKAQRLSATGSFSWCLDTDEIIFSEEARRIFGFKPDDVVTLELIGSRVHPDDLPLLAERTAARSSGETHDYEIRLLMPDGTVKYLHTTSNETRGAGGRREYIGALHDVTQRRLAEESLNKARNELAHVSRITSLNALTASIAHEINQPLSGIITNASTCLRMLNANPPNVEGARRYRV